MLNIDNVCISNNILPLSRPSPITSDAELSNSEELGLTVPLTPDKFAEAAVSAAIENITNTKPVSETTIPNKDILLPMDEASSATKKPFVSVTNDSGPQVTTTMSKENNRETETPLSLSLTGGDTGDVETQQTMALHYITDDVTTPDESLEQNAALLGVTVSGNGVPPGSSSHLGISDNAAKEPMDVDINNEPNETLHGITVTGNVITAPLHGVTDLNSLDHSYSRQTNDSSIVNHDYYATTEDEDYAVEGLLQLSATDNPRVDFPGDNSQLLPIGARIPNAAPMDINLETAAVTAAIENITLEETVSKTTNTVSTQTTFTRQRHNRPIELSEWDTDDEALKKPITRSPTKVTKNPRSPKKAEFKTVKYGIKKRRSS